MKLAGIPKLEWACLVVVLFALRSTKAASDRDAARNKLRMLREEIDEFLAQKKQQQSSVRGGSSNERKLPKYESKSKHDPCVTPVGGKEGFVLLKQPGYLFSPSFWVGCAKSLKVDYKNMLLHIKSLNDIFKDYHSLYDMAKDPLNSEPANFQPELGQSLYSGANEGVVDFDKEMALLSDKIAWEEYASMYTFWEIGTSITAFRDGHVTAPYAQGLFSLYRLFALPAKLLDPHNKIILAGVLPRFYMDEHAKIQLTITYALQQLGSTETYLEVKEIDYINDYTVHDFTVMLADCPSAPLAFPSLGARTSFLMRQGSIFNSDLVWEAIPPDTVPDSFYVKYKDGKYEKYQTVISPVHSFPFVLDFKANKAYHALNREETENFINQPGAQFDAYQRSIAELSPDFGEPARKLMHTQDPEKTKFQTFVPMLSPDNELQRRRLDEEQEEEEGPPLAVWGEVSDDTLFFKLPAFASDFDFLGMWSEILTEANAGGHTKLIIDYSRNGGGLVSTSYGTVMAFFPEVGLDWFTDQWDISYNDAMKEWLDTGIPLISSIQNEYDILSVEDIEARIDMITDQDIENYRTAIGGMIELCNDALSVFVALPNEEYCQNYVVLSNSLESFVETRGWEMFDTFIRSLQFLVADTNPWTVTLKGQDELRSTLQQADPVTRIRGGVESKTTIKYDVLGADIMEIIFEYVQNVTEAFGGNPFEQYVFLSSGDSQSAAAISPFTSSQLSKNAPRTGATRKVKLVSYGGTGKAEDMVHASIPASVQDIRISEPIIGDALLQLLVDALPDSIGSLDTIVAETQEYSKVVAVPPYFAGSLPRVPTRTFYDISMEPGAAPLQFVKFPLDGYIPKIYNAVTFENGAELGDLYGDALEFFE